MTTNGLQWKFSQVLGDEATPDEVHDEDIITALEFDTTGRYISLGDKAGRLIVFDQSKTTKDENAADKYQYLTEIQSHKRQFDYLKSSEIEERINQIQWLRPQGKNMYIITTNDKTIKTWKISDKASRRLQPSDVEAPADGLNPTLLRSYPNLHSYHINSLSVCSNGENFISGDDLKVNLWTLDRTSDAFNIVDLKPDNLEEISEVITSAKFHPVSSNLFLYSTSKGTVKIGDLRKSSQCEKTAITLEVPEDAARRNFFTDIIVSICDASFSQNGKYVFARDFCTIKVWDIANTSQPLATIPIFDPIKAKLCELYENECIFDKFGLASGPDSNQVVTGMFNGNFHIVDMKRDVNTQFELNFDKKTVSKVIPRRYTEVLGSDYDYSRKVIRSAYHPNEHVVAVACLNSLFFYKAV